MSKPKTAYPALYQIAAELLNKCPDLAPEAAVRQVGLDAGLAGNDLEDFAKWSLENLGRAK